MVRYFCEIGSACDIKEDTTVPDLLIKIQVLRNVSLSYFYVHSEGHR